jgi:hypothetical protein
MLVLPISKDSIYPDNFLIYLNDFSQLIPYNALTGTPAGSADIAYYLSSFNFIMFNPNAGVTNTNIQIMQETLTYNPNLVFYAWIDGKTIVDQANPTPNTQIINTISSITAEYNLNSILVGGIYVDNFELLNVGLGTLSGQTFRDAQISFLLETSRQGLQFALATPGHYASSTGGIASTGGYPFISNMQWILNLISDTLPTTVEPYNATTNIPTLSSVNPNSIVIVTTSGTVVINSVLTSLSSGNVVYKDSSGNLYVVLCDLLTTETTVNYNAYTNVPTLSSAANNTVFSVSTAGTQTINSNNYQLKLGDIVIKDNNGAFFVVSTYNSYNFSNNSIFFDSNCTIVDYTLYGYGLNSVSAPVGYTDSTDFFSNLLLVNSILTNPFNYSCSFAMALTTNNYNSYTDSTFFSPSSAPAISTGAAQYFYNLATMLNATAVATAAYPDFYLTESGGELVNSIFPFATVPATGNGNTYYYPRSKLVTLNQSQLGFQSNKSITLSIFTPNGTTYNLVLNGQNYLVGSPVIWY